MEICLAVRQEIDRGQISRSAIGRISIAEVLSVLEREPGDLKFRHTFKVLKVSINSSILEF